MPPETYDVALDYANGHFVQVDAARCDQSRGES
jgi:hypothetical protein